LHRVGVHPDHRNKGIGSLLIDNAKTFCKSLGLFQVEVLVPEYWLDPSENRGVIPFVENNKMTPVDHKRDYYFHYGKLYDAILYRTTNHRPGVVAV
jgi:GNAT superfamily N-acetyltransferase